MFNAEIDNSASASSVKPAWHVVMKGSYLVEPHETSSMVCTHTLHVIVIQVSYVETYGSQGFNKDFWWPWSTFNFIQTYGSLYTIMMYSHGYKIHLSKLPSDITFQIWTCCDSKSSSTKTKWLSHKIWDTNMQTTRIIKPFLLVNSGFQGFKIFTSVDWVWPDLT